MHILVKNRFTKTPKSPVKKAFLCALPFFPQIPHKTNLYKNKKANAGISRFIRFGLAIACQIPICFGMKHADLLMAERKSLAPKSAILRIFATFSTKATICPFGIAIGSLLCYPTVRMGVFNFLRPKKEGA